MATLLNRRETGIDCWSHSCCKASSLLKQIDRYSRWLCEAVVAFLCHSVHFSSLESPGHGESCVVVSHRGFYIAGQWATGGISSGEMGGGSWECKGGWKRALGRGVWKRAKLGTVTCMLPLERSPSDLLPKLYLTGASERASWWPSGRGREQMERQRSNTQALSLASLHLAACTYRVQITSRPDFTSSALHFHKINDLLQTAHMWVWNRAYYV